MLLNGFYKDLIVYLYIKKYIVNREYVCGIIGQGYKEKVKRRLKIIEF